MPEFSVPDTPDGPKSISLYGNSVAGLTIVAFRFAQGILATAQP